MSNSPATDMQDDDSTVRNDRNDVRYSDGEEDFTATIRIIDTLFKKAAPDVRQKVHAWGDQLFNSFSRLVPLRFETGFALANLKELCKKEDIQWDYFCNQINWVRRTADLYIEQYLEASKVHKALRSEALKRGYDLSENKYKILRKRLQELTRDGFDLGRADRLFDIQLQRVRLIEAQDKENEASKQARDREVSIQEAERQLSETVVPDEAEESFDDKYMPRSPREGMKWYVRTSLATQKSKQWIMERVIKVVDDYTTATILKREGLSPTTEEESDSPALQAVQD